MLSVGFGHDVHYLTASVTTGRESYYTGATEAGGEPPGQWYGSGAALLGLTGEASTEAVEAVYHRLQDPRNPKNTLGAAHKHYRTPVEIHRQLLEAEGAVTPERRQELLLQAEGQAKQAVAFTDVTLNCPKSISVLGVALERAAVEAERGGREEEAAGWRVQHKAVEEAVLAGSRAAIDYLEEVAGYGRVGKHGAGADRWQDSHQWVASLWLQHDTRDHDPHLHVHAAILNRQLCADGQWRGLDNMAIKLHRAGASAISERVIESMLAQTLGIRFETRPDGKAREIVGIDQDVMEMFSSRRRAIGPKVDELVKAFRERYGTEPSPLQRTHLSQQATLATRRAKSHDGESLAQRLDRWEQMTQHRLSTGLAGVADAVLSARQDAGPVATWSSEDVVQRAIAKVAVGNAAWTRSDLMRAVSDSLPGHLGLDPSEVRPLLEELTDIALAETQRLTPTPDLSLRPAEHLLADGGDVYARPGSAKFSAPGQIPAEELLREAAVERGAMAVSTAEADALIQRYRDHGVDLGADQEAALRGVLTSGAMVEAINAPAGAGKTVVTGALAQVWAEHGRAVLGLAPSQVAADVMADEGVPAVNIDRWLHSADAGLRHGDVVVVDEAGMASTQHLVAVRERCREAGAKMLLVGDPQQLGAVGPGGALQDMTERAKTYELAEVRRFSQPWERHASLGLRDGSAACLDEYDRHGRIRGSGTQDQAEASAIRAWLADTLEGKQSLLMAGSNEASERMAGAARAELVRLGKLPEEGVRLGRDGNTCGVGDLVQARRNGWHLASSSGVPINRATYRVQEVEEDGSLVVSPVLGDKLGDPVKLPADYVNQHVSLGYAATVHSSQGRTVHSTHSVVSQAWSTALTYVGMTRGRESNTAWVVTRPTPTDSPAGQAQEVHDRPARAVLAEILERDSVQRSALAERDSLEAEARSEFTVVGQLIDGVSRSTAGQTSTLLDHLTASGAITEEQRRDLAQDDAMGAVERLLRSAEVAGHDRQDLLADALAGRSLAGARSPGQVLHHRLHRDLQLDSTIGSFRDLIPRQVQDHHRAWLEDRAEAADVRRHELGAEIAQDPPVWALEALGPVPEDPLERAGWEAKAGWAGASREISGYDSETDPLGPAPPAGLAEKHTIWRTAHQHLGLTDRGPEEGLLSDGLLRQRVAAFEREQNWAPAVVREALAATSRAAADRHVDGVLREAHGDDTAVDAAAESLVLAESAKGLDEADRARQAWFEHVAETREHALRAAAELKARGVDVYDESGKVTAREWLDAHREAQEADERGKPIDRLAEDDVTEVVPLDESQPIVETAVPDVRDTSERHPSEDVDDDTVAGMERTREAVARAQDALDEIRQRESLDESDYEPDAVEYEPDVDEQDLVDVWD
ncbi:conjugative relaxase-like TrwC/TraI family protein [Pseudonocardia sediminis]|uniref:Conjugative relaxase-like TrwC/TraI family protein n=1 Tax=Pseudonocardia sediminis TaxID=1397368 RepID=A0A4Q7V3X6_PSEST|nr:MobF family relaxase [Pseudonocardia sediminis]RZT87413.1 conjugative relaxase-like TrwC/TraI family protein [Pseudonocardia sediminis]